MRLNPYVDIGKFEARRDHCFVIMPFRQAWSGDVWENSIKQACALAGVIPIRGDEIMGPNILVDIWCAINECHAFVADVTGANPNVMYELGLAHALMKDVILIAQAESDIPFDLKPYRHVLYSTDAAGIVRLTEHLKIYLQEIFFRGPDNFGRFIRHDDLVVLYLSTGGTCRCAMANVVTRLLMSGEGKEQVIEDAEHGIRCVSAGRYGESEEFISNNARTALLQKFGVEVGHHRTLRATIPLQRRADIILAMDVQLQKGLSLETKEKVKVFPEFFRAGGELPDPYGSSIAEYRTCLDRIYDIINNNINALLDLKRKRVNLDR